MSYLKFFIHILSCLYLFYSVAFSYEFNESQKPVFQFADTGNFSDQLIKTTELISFLTQSYGKTIQSISLHNGVQDQLNWDFNWSQNYLGAGSSLNQQKFTIMIYGGYVRAEGMSFELLALTLCHELGHYLGGEPKQVFNGIKDWSSSEGQSDYFAARECLPKVYQFFKNKKNYLKITLTKSEQDIFCSVSNSDIRQQCLWSMSAALEFAKFAHHYFDRDSQVPSVLKKASEEPSSSLVSVYPTTQCRLDTYITASRCAAGEVSFCQRPRCWYKP